MAKELTGGIEVLQGDTSGTASTPEVRLGTRAKDVDGGEYIYLQGTASVIQFSAVTFDENFTTSLASADGVGPVAFAQDAINTGEYGWFQIYGVGTAAVENSVAADVALFLTSSGGFIDDADVAGDLIEGANSIAASSGSAVGVFLNYPQVYNVAQD